MKSWLQLKKGHNINTFTVCFATGCLSRSKKHVINRREESESDCDWRRKRETRLRRQRFAGMKSLVSQYTAVLFCYWISTIKCPSLTIWSLVLFFSFFHTLPFYFPPPLFPPFYSWSTIALQQEENFCPSPTFTTRSGCTESRLRSTCAFVVFPRITTLSEYNSIFFIPPSMSTCTRYVFQEEHRTTGLFGIIWKDESFYINDKVRLL